MGIPIKVLLVEDDAGDAELTIRALRAGGFEPVSKRVDTAPEFAEALDTDDWQIVISDHRMPTFSSLEALEMLLARHIDVPFLLVSGTIGEEAAASVMRAGAKDYILKDNLTRLPVAVARELHEASERSRRREAELGQAAAEERYREMVEQIPAVTYRVSLADGEVVTAFVSPQIEAFTGYSPAEWGAQPMLWIQTLHPEDRQRVIATLTQTRIDDQPFLAEYRVQCRSGATVWLRSEGRWSTETDGRRTLQGFIVDISDRRRAEETIHHLAFHDGLTGLANGPSLHDELGREIEQAREANRSVAVLRLCVRRLREINSTLGRLNGDQIIQKVGTRLQGIEQARFVARLGAAEFAMLVSGADAAGARRVADRCVAVLQEPIVIEGLPVEVDACVGIAMFPGHGEDSDTLLRRADVALDNARRSPSGSALYSKADDPYDPRRLVMMGELRRAIEGDQLRLEYQPKIDLQSHHVVGVEALLRWTHPELGNVPPYEFVCLAEESALIRPLTRWVLNEACRQSRAWRQAGMQVPIAVNLSARNLIEADLADFVAGLLETWGLPPSALELEITESAIMAEPKRAADLLEVLASRGMAIAIDDFGTGYSSLAYLRRLRASEVKIDRSFVIGLSKDEGDLAIVRAVIDLGHRMGLRVVAEGVEDAKTFEILASAGCDLAQGYHMARPMPAADFSRWLGGGSYGLAEPVKEEGGSH